GDQREDVVGEGGQQTLVADGADPRRVLGPELVGVRRVTPVEDGGGEIGRAIAVADLDLDPGLVLELLDDRVDEVLVATRVDDQLLSVSATFPAGGGRRG